MTSVAEERATSTSASRSVWLTDLSLLGMAIIWGVNFTVVKVGTRVLEPLAYNGVRVALAAVALLVIAGLRRGGWPARRVVLALLGLGIIGNGVYQIFFIEGIARTRAGSAALVLAATPVFIALLGRMRGVERIGARGLAGIALSVAGIGLIVLGSARGSSGPGTLLGNLLVLGGAVAWSVFTVMLKPYTHQVNAIQISALTMLGGAVPLLLFASPTLAGTDWRGVPGVAWGSIVYSGLGALVIAYLFWYRGVKVLGPTRTAMYGNLQPLIALLVAWVWLHEVPTLWQGLGAAGILAGLVLTRS